MPKIKDPAVTLAPGYKVPDIGISQKGVAKSPPPRVIPSGKRILAQAVGELGRSVGDMAKYLIVAEKNMNIVGISDSLADLKNDLNQHYINNIAPLRSGKAKDVFKHEVETMAGMKEIFLQGTEGNKRVHGTLSLEFDKVAQTHLKKVFNHKLTQDATFAEDTALKVAKTLQGEMSTLTLDDSSRAIDISNQLDTQLADYPELRDAIKITAWKGMFKYNARINPELTQIAYENKTMRKSIVNQIGFEGYSLIQEAIDKGRSIGIQDKALEKMYEKERIEEQTEITMKGAMHLLFTKPDDFTATYIDKLGTDLYLPSQEQRILRGLLASLTKEKLADIDTDWPTYIELLEEMSRGKRGDISIGETQNKIANAINRTITVGQGQYMLKALANRDIFDKPTIQAAYDELNQLYRDGDFFVDPVEYEQAVRSLTKTVLDSNGDVEKVQKYMSDVLRPPDRKSGVQRWLENTFPSIVRRQPEFTLVPSPLMPYMLDWEKEEIDKLLFLKGHNITHEDAPVDDIQLLLNHIRSEEYQKGK